MSIVNSGLLADDLYVPDITPIYTDDVQSLGTLGTVVFCRHDGGAGTYTIQIQAFPGQWDDLFSATVSAGVLLSQDTGFFVPRLRVKFIADAGSSFPTRLWVSAYSYPSVYTRQGDMQWPLTSR